MTVPRSAASSRENKLSPGSQPSARALSQDLLFWFLTDDHLDAIFAHIKRLGGTLDAVSQDGYDFILQYLAGFLQGEFFPGNDFFFNTGEI